MESLQHQQLAAGQVQIYSRGEPQISTGNFELTPGQSLFRKVTVDLGNNHLLGTTTDAEGEPLAGAGVALQHSSDADGTGVAVSDKQPLVKRVNSSFRFWVAARVP